MAISDIDKVGARVVWAIGARDESAVFDRTTTDDRFDDEEIERALIETESEILRDIAESYHPYRTDFLEWSSVLANGETIPKHFGNLEEVEILPYTGATEYITGQSESRENIRLWRENHNNRFDALNHNVFGSSLTGYFCLTNQTLEFTGVQARVRIFSYTPDYATPALQIDDAWDSLLIVGAIPKLERAGIQLSLVQNSLTQYLNGRNAIKQGMRSVPEINITQQNDK